MEVLLLALGLFNLALSAGVAGAVLKIAAKLEGRDRPEEPKKLMSPRGNDYLVDVPNPPSYADLIISKSPSKDLILQHRDES